MNFNMSMCCAQCYNGASNKYEKTAREIKAIEPRALYIVMDIRSLNL